MKHIENVNKWMLGKTVKSVDQTAVNCHVIFFTDGTAILCEAENQGHLIYGPTWYEIDPAKPVHEQ